MANYYCDHGAYGLASNRLGLDAPVTWAVPQEGDGTGLNAATASGVGSIAFASVPTTGTISVCGVTVSTTGVIGAATADAAANTLATNINATATAVAAGVAVGLPQLRNLVYARGPSGGAPAGTCQVMMRIGSASLNYASNSNCQLATTFDGSPTLVQFVGGTGGCWGWFINPAAIGVSNSITAITYGVWLYKPYVGTVPTGTDTVYCRTGGGASKTVALAFVGGATYSHAAFSKGLVFDTNTVWTGDSAVGTLKVVITGSTWNTTKTLNLLVNGYVVSYRALRRGGFEIEYTASDSQAPLVSASPGVIHMTGVVFRDSSTQTSSYFNPFSVSGTSSSLQRVMESCDFVVTTPRAALWAAIIPCSGYSTSSSQLFLGCTFDFNISGVADPGPVLSNAYQIETHIAFRHCQFKGFASGYKLLTSLGSWAANGTRLSVTVDCCSGLAMPAAYLGFPVSTGFIWQGTHQWVFSNSSDPVSPGLRIEDCRGVAEWVPSDPTPFPTLASTLPSGAAWALRLIWVQAVPLSRGQSYESPPLRMLTQLSAAVRAVTLELLIPSTISSGLRLSVGYTDSSGLARREETEVIASSSASWANAGSYSGYAAKKMSLTTSYAIAANSEVVCTMQLVEVAPSTVVNLYLDPEFTVT